VDINATRTTLAAITGLARQLGTDLPDAVTAAAADLQTLRTARPSHNDDVPDIGTAYADAILAGRDPLASKDVQRAVLFASVSQMNIDNRLEIEGCNRVATALEQHADEIIETWRPAVAMATAAIDSFMFIAPGADLSDPDIARKLPAVALTPWGEARNALADLAKIAQVWLTLAQATGLRARLQGCRPLIFADLSYEAVQSKGHDPQAEVAALLTAEVELASRATFEARAAAFADERAAAPGKAAADRALAYADAVRRAGRL